MKNLVYLIILTVLFVSGISAHSRVISSSELVESGTDIAFSNQGSNLINLLGVQSAQGISDLESDVRSGNTFVFNGSREDVAVHLTISMDYTAAEPDMVIGNKVFNGTWTLTVYKNDVYFGVMYGNVSTGTIVWNTNERDQISSRQTEVELNLTGGLDGYADNSVHNLPNTLSATSYFSLKGEAITEAVLDLPL